MLDSQGKADLVLFQPDTDALIVDPRVDFEVPEDAETGETILDGRRLLHLSRYDNKLVFLCLASTMPNPNQPRTFFEEEKMEALRATIGEKGQSNPIHVVPLCGVHRSVSFLIIDGERRFRVLQELGADYIKAIIRYFPTAHDVFEESLVLNVSRQDHTPVELAYAYQRMLDHYEAIEGGKEAAMDRLLRRLTNVSRNHVINHLRLLKLGPATQKVLARISASDYHDKFPTNAQLQLASAKERYGGDLDDLRAARLILDNPDKQFDVAISGTRAGMLSRAGVAQAIQAALVLRDRESKERVRQLQTALKVNAVLGALANVKRATRPFTPPHAKSDFLSGAIEVMKERGGKSPDKIREEIREVLGGLQAFHDNVVAPSMEPDRLEIPVGAPLFSEEIQRLRRRISNKERYLIAQALAATSDAEGKVLSAHEIVEALSAKGTHIESVAVGVHMRHMREDLDGANLRVDEHEVRRKTITEDGSEGIRRLVPGWRLAWTDDYIDQMSGDGTSA